MRVRVQQPEPITGVFPRKQTSCKRQQAGLTPVASTKPAIEVRVNFIPEQSYNAQVQAAAIAGELPDLLEFDGPFLYNYVWQGHLRPLDDLLSAGLTPAASTRPR